MIKRSRKIVAGFFGFLGALTTLYAAHQMFLKERRVPYVEMDIDLCGPIGKGTPPYRLAQALLRQEDDFLYIEMELSRSESGCETPTARGGFRPDYGPERTMIMVSAGAIEVRHPDFPDLLQRPNMYVELEPRAYAGQRHTQFQTVEDFIHVEIAGLFLVRKEWGEGDLYFSLLPAPANSENNDIYDCTSAMRDRSALSHPFTYLGACIFV